MSYQIRIFMGVFNHTQNNEMMKLALAAQFAG